MIKLEKDKKYILENLSIKCVFKICHHDDGYYLNFIDRLNNTLFKFYSIDKIALSEKTLGYYDGGNWPFCRSIRDCEKLLDALLTEINKISYIHFYCESEVGNSKNCWDD